MSRRKKTLTSAQLGPQERLTLFRKRTAELENLRLIQSGANMQFRLSWDIESKLRYEATEPDEDDLRSFLLLFRQFISTSEPVYINRIFNDCLQYLNDDLLKGEINKARDSWHKRINAGPVKILRQDRRPISPEYMLDLWINGYYFHNDPSKAEELENLLTQPVSLARMQFLNDFVALVPIVQYMGNVVAHCLDSQLFQIPSDSASEPM